MAESFQVVVKCPVPNCTYEHILETEIEPADPHYGADADGNRGMYVAAGPLIPDTPSICPECHTEYSVEDMEQLAAEIEKQCEAWEPDEDDGYYDPD